jgi:hypothetical protein
VDPRGRSTRERSCRGAFGNQVAAQRGTLEVDAVRAMDDAVEDGIGPSRPEPRLWPTASAGPR